MFHLSNDAAIRPADVGRAVLSTAVRIRSMDGSITDTTLANCANPLGLAYLTATTKSAEISKFLPNEIYGSYVKVGSPIMHVRVSSGRYIETGRDKRLISGDGDSEILVTSASGYSSRNGIIVQSSQKSTFEEKFDERIARVLFSHMNSILFAYSHVASASQEGKIVGRKQELREMLKGMLDRLSRFAPAKIDSDGDNRLHVALGLFAKAYEGRIEELSEKLTGVAEKLASPTVGENVRLYVKALHDLVIKSGIEAAVKATMK